MKYYVNASAEKYGSGTKEAPFLTISEAAAVAMPGDTVSVAPGVYRESVDPKWAGTKDGRITYESEEPLKAVIKGSELLTGWEPVSDGVYVTRVNNSIFPTINPYTERVSGDWFVAFMVAHLGEVFLNGKSLYEVTSLEEVRNPVKNLASWDPDFTVYTWYTEQDEEKDETVIYANFHEYNPNQECVEFTTRETCFYPSKEGVGYITLRGFLIQQAATQWAPPTAYQIGMVGPHWSKGWIIEDCEISDSKCSGISLGKYLQPENNNKWLKNKLKDGTQTERECIMRAQREGWTKERIGSHIVRRCNIHDCGQTGIVGHLGGVFSIIEDNHIHHINNKHNLAGAEIGGIKMHAAIDCIFRRNHIHHCTRGLWLDWQVQGTRVTKNLFHDNTWPKDLPIPEGAGAFPGEDIFVEIAHGPSLIDNNVLLSERALKVPTQGMAIVHNFIAGSLACVGSGVNNGAATLSSPRYTPYHVPHETEVEGFMTVMHGDMRFFNNIFLQTEVREDLKRLMEAIGDSAWDTSNLTVGTSPYEGYMTWDEYVSLFDGYCGMGSAPSDRYYLPLPVWAGGNVYVNGAVPMTKETDAEVLTIPELPKAMNALQDTASRTPGDLTVVSAFRDALTSLLPETEKAQVSTETLAPAFEPEEKFENPDGTPIFFTEDFFSNPRAKILAGPFS